MSSLCDEKRDDADAPGPLCNRRIHAIDKPGGKEFEERQINIHIARHGTNARLYLTQRLRPLRVTCTVSKQDQGFAHDLT